MRNLTTGGLKTLARQFMRLIFLLVLCLSSVSSFSQTLAQELAYQSNREAYWQSRIANLNAIESNLYRDLNFHPSMLEQLRDEILNKNYTFALNLFANMSPEVIHRQLSADIISGASNHIYHLNRLLNYLPPLEVTSYSALWVPPSNWTKMQVDELLEDSELFHATGSLNVAHQWFLPMQNVRLRQNKIQIIIKIESKSGRLMNTFFQDQQAMIMFPLKTQFKIVEKEHDPVQNKYFLHVQETQAHHASVPPKAKTCS